MPSDSPQSLRRLLRSVLLFVCLFAVVWVALDFAHKKLRYVQAGSDLVLEEKYDKLSKQALFSGQEKYRVIAMGNSKTLSSFRPDVFDAAFPGVVAAENESDETLLAIWRQMTTPVGADAFLRQQQAIVNRADLRYMLPAITCPTAIIHGAGDRLIPIAAAEESAAALTTATYTVIKDAGHFLFHEQPAAARAAIVAWLDLVV